MEGNKFDTSLTWDQLDTGTEEKGGVSKVVACSLLTEERYRQVGTVSVKVCTPAQSCHQLAG